MTNKVHCPVCDRDKDKTEFGKDSRRKSGRKWTCKACDRKYAKARYDANNGEAQAWANRKSRYNIDKDTFFEMLDKQVGLCSVCREKLPDPRKIHIDHDHETGRVRGLLCQRCNILVGVFENNKHLIGNIVDYLL